MKQLMQYVPAFMTYFFPEKVEKFEAKKAKENGIRESVIASLNVLVNSGKKRPGHTKTLRKKRISDRKLADLFSISNPRSRKAFIKAKELLKEYGFRLVKSSNQKLFFIIAVA